MCRAITVSFVLLAFCFVVNGDVKDASEFGALGSLRKALLETEANAGGIFNLGRLILLQCLL